jgi:hypothetical protein
MRRLRGRAWLGSVALAGCSSFEEAGASSDGGVEAAADAAGDFSVFCGADRCTLCKTD